METKRLLEHRRTIKKRKPQFLRKDWHKISGLGLRRVKKQVWRKAKGRHNKIRQKHKGHGKNPSIGYSSPRFVRGTIEGFTPVLVRNVNDLAKIGKQDIAIVAHVGLRNKIAIVKKADEMGINIQINKKKFFREAEERIEKIKSKKAERKTEEKKAEKSKQKESKKESKEKQSEVKDKVTAEQSTTETKPEEKKNEA